MRRGLFGWALPAYSALVYIFLYLPIAVIVLFAFDAKAIPGLPLQSLTMAWFKSSLSDSRLVGSLLTSLRLAVIAAILSTALAMPAAMVLAWRPMRMKSLVLCLVLGPVVLPQLVLGLALTILLRAAPDLIGQPAIVLAHTTMTSSYATLMLYSQFLGFRRSYIEAAMNLGADEFVTFRQIVLPLIWPAVVAVLLLAFTDAFGEFVVAWFMAGFTETLPIALWTSLRQFVSPKIYALSALVILVTLALSVSAQIWILGQTRRENQA
ncbi:spermidine/putrescine transport system permease protein [Arboricoccus pini]|uniref:Spermidine/putrescine transport system permease protein n=1 Tax=Arboricoccus pini TaxID=1963835 RepID=A0A212RG68_9PROT|nr:ABC transporter permease [Arboricoccus pini]SNB71170.1 spermidine/putrescine transport system permease protein [Arboricoccus pini]